MFDKKKANSDFEDKSTNDVFRHAKGDAKVVIGNGDTITGEIKKADEVQIDGEADITMKTDNVVIIKRNELFKNFPNNFLATRYHSLEVVRKNLPKRKLKILKLPFIYVWNYQFKK